MLTIDIESSGLDPAVDFITAVGVLNDNKVTVFSSPAKDFRNSPVEAEGKLLQSLLNFDFSYDNALLSYNGESFDIPFVRTRLLAHKLPALPFLGTEHHIDLMHYATFINGGTRISKDSAAFKFTNLYVPRNSSGAYLAAIYRQRIVSDDEHLSMWHHLSQDLFVTQRLFNKWNTYPEFEEFYTRKFPDFRTWCPKWDSSLPPRISPAVEPGEDLGGLFG